MLKRLCVSLSLLAAVACGSNSSTAPTPTQANITVTLAPNPVTTTVCSPPCQGSDGRLFQFRAQGTLTLQETAGIAGNVDSITVTIFSSTIVYGADVVVQRSGTNHVAGRGMLIFPLNIFHVPVDTPNTTRQVVMPFVVQFTDDRGNKLTGTAQWSVN